MTVTRRHSARQWRCEFLRRACSFARFASRARHNAAVSAVTLAEFITESADRIISEWEQFARSCIPAANLMDLEERKDHLAGMLAVIAADLRRPQTASEQQQKATGQDDAHADSDTPANSHGTDRAASGYNALHMVSRFRALRARCAPVG